MDSTETTETTETTDNAANDAPAEPKERSIDEIRESAVPKIAAKMSGKDAETEQPKAETDTEEPQVDWDDLAERSIAVGMSDEDLEKYTDPKALEEALKDQESKGRSADDSQDDEDPFVSDDELDLENEWLDEDVRDRIRTLRDKYESEQSQLRSELDSLRGEVEKNNKLAEARRFDTALADQGKAYHKLFGDGPTADLDPKSTGYQNRQALREEMDTIAAGLKARGKSVPAEAELFKKALRSAFGDEMHKIEKSRLQSKISKRQKQMTVSPNPRNVGSHTPVNDPDQQIINKIADKMAKQGMTSY